jgi:hypothetical protein
MSTKIFLVMLALLSLVPGASTAWAQSSEDKAEPTTRPSPPKSKAAHSTIFPEDVPGLRKLAIESYQNGNYMRFVQATMNLRKKRPYDQEYMVGMVVGAARLGRMNTAYNYMHIMQQQGLSYDFNSTDDTQNIRDTEVYDYLNDLLVKAGDPMGQGRLAFTLPDASVVPETIAWDDGRGRFLVGTIESGSIISVTPSGEVEELLRSADDNGLLAITGLAVDENRGRLWVSTAGVPGFKDVLPTELGRGALLEFDLKTLKFLDRYDVPVDGLPHVPGSIVVTPGGDVYLIDRAVQMVFRKLAGAKKLEAYLANQDLTGFRDLAISDAGSKLYLADAALGIAVVDLGGDTLTMLGGPESMNLGGISGLMFSEGHLFVIQSGITPQRLMRLDLSPDGFSVTKATPLAVALEDFDSPAFGTIQGGTVYYFASGNVAGAQREPSPVKVLKTPVEPSEDIVPVEQRKYEADKLKRQAPSPLDPSRNPKRDSDP